MTAAKISLYDQKHLHPGRTQVLFKIYHHDAPAPSGKKRQVQVQEFSRGEKDYIQPLAVFHRNLFG